MEKVLQVGVASNGSQKSNDIENYNRDGAEDRCDTGSGNKTPSRGEDEAFGEGRPPISSMRAALFDHDVYHREQKGSLQSMEAASDALQNGKGNRVGVRRPQDWCTVFPDPV
jgi:hypothetical protein